MCPKYRDEAERYFPEEEPDHDKARKMLKGQPHERIEPRSAWLERQKRIADALKEGVEKAEQEKRMNDKKTIRRVIIHADRLCILQGEM